MLFSDRPAGCVNTYIVPELMDTVFYIFSGEYYQLRLVREVNRMVGETHRKQRENDGGTIVPSPFRWFVVMVMVRSFRCLGYPSFRIGFGLADTSFSVSFFFC